MELTDVIDEVEQAIEQEQKQEAPVAPVADADAVMEKVLMQLAQLGAEAQGPRQSQPVSHFDLVAERLQAQGVTPAALANYRVLAEAMLADKEQISMKEAAVRNQQAYDAHCFQLAFDALDEVTEGMKPLQREEIKKALVKDMSNTVRDDVRFKDILDAVKRGIPPSKTRMKVVAAEVADKYCAELGIKKPAGQIDLRSSKPNPTESQALDIDSLPRGARQIYEATLKYTKDPDKAMKRAVQAVRG